MRRRIKVFIDAERCKACEYCRSACPKGIIQMSENFNKRGYHYAFITRAKECSGCKFCAVLCPEVAIEIEVVG